ncbi:DUF4625 domain-containing protein [Lacinutrix gracilariae]|uniref:DUF4625 domain-containing protein n=1 Tax=Lacinutrix gracilariae TaxID=1747198 RepID=A0ABW5JXG1_9FLAO
MKTNFKFLAILAFFATFLNSCSSDDDAGSTLAAPVISNFEYGEGSDHSTEQFAYKTSDIHLEADIFAEATVSSIAVSIHAHDLTPAADEVEWHFEQVFTDSNYLVMNPTFHEHISVPNNIPAGEYHVELTVTDTQGNSTEVEGHILILDVITISEVSVDSTVVRGSNFHAEFFINALNGVHTITLDIHAHGITPGAGETEYDQELVFEEGYHELNEVEFHEHITVPADAPAGEYHITFTVEDENGNTEEFETHIDITA